MKGITIETHEHTEDLNYLILLKKSKTKLVLDADSTVELDGWYKTLASVCKGVEETIEQENERSPASPAIKHRYENIESDDSLERGREINKSKAKVPIPTPRNRTPSRDQQTKDVNEEKITEEKEIRAMKRLEDVVALKSNPTKTNSVNVDYQVSGSELVFPDYIQYFLQNGFEDQWEVKEDAGSKEQLDLSDKQLVEKCSNLENSDREDTENYKWCVPASATSDETTSTASSSDEEEVKPKFSAPIIADGHKFSDGIVWETIEECDEEDISSSDSDKAEIAINHDEKKPEVVNMKNDSNEGSGMTREHSQDKKDRFLSHKPFINPLTHVNKPERDNERLDPKVGFLTPVGNKQVSEMDMEFPTKFSSETNLSVTDMPNLLTNSNFNNSFSTESLKEYFEPREVPSRIQSGDDIIDGDECSLCPDKKEPPVKKEEIGNISVKNLAKFWEEVSKTVIVEKKSVDQIQKKWNSMPNLKERRQLPMRPITNTPSIKKEAVINYVDVVRSDDQIDDVDLCRSVSLRDRKQQFELMATQTKREKAKQWKSMPSLNKGVASKGKVHFKDEEVSGNISSRDSSSESRGRSPVRELMKNFQPSPPSILFQRDLSPVSPILKTNEISFKDESLSSSDSFSSSMTGSSMSTVISRSQRAASLLDDSSGEIYTGDRGTHGEDTRPYMVENGHEYSLTPLTTRKQKFDHHQYDPRVFKGSPQPGELHQKSPSPVNNSPNTIPRERVVSTNLPYIEEEQDVLKSINIVQSLKSKFLN